ncbi:hypothetical protein IWW38_002526 [Coemansia aciculifera]|uniref:Uncharacterized protein n=1 Tax=Coemansia aciculifera TaxID=417176 RepID=A0ACC1M3A7_9FUNG|nr:hypothetical protein IWW38_002526 [Coemansia aciculifera]
MSCQHEANEDDYHNHDHSGCDHSHDDEAETGHTDSLYSKVLVDKAWCLNESEPDSIKRVFKPWHLRMDTTRFVTSSSGDDPELLVYVPFSGMVKLKSVFVWGGASDEAPESIRVFANRDDLDFDNVAGATPTQEWDLVRGARAPVEYPVRPAKFAAVRSLTLHLPRSFATDNGDDDERTKLCFLSFRGDWMPLTANPVISVYELTPNAADHKAPASELSHSSIS